MLKFKSLVLFWYKYFSFINIIVNIISIIYIYIIIVVIIIIIKYIYNKYMYNIIGEDGMFEKNKGGGLK